MFTKIAFIFTIFYSFSVTASSIWLCGNPEKIFNPDTTPEEYCRLRSQDGYKDCLDDFHQMEEKYINGNCTPPALVSSHPHEVHPCSYDTMCDRNGKPITGWGISYSQTGKPFREGNFKNGKEDGLHSFYDGEGRLVMESIYENGKRLEQNPIEVAKEYQESEVKNCDSMGWSKCDLAGVPINGVFQKYYPNGSIKEKGIYKQGEIENKKSYYEDGSLKTDIYGKSDGGVLIREYYKNGQLEEEYNLNKRKGRDGISRSYYESGKLKSEYNYRDTDILRGKSYYEDGSLKTDIYGKSDRGVLTKQYYKNGQLKSEENVMREGFKDGVSKYYYENGQLSYTVNYKKEKEDGPVKSYYENGHLKGEFQFQDGKKVGIWKYYYDNGNLKEEEKYVDGKLEGILKKYSKNGELLQEEGYKNGLRDGNLSRYYNNELKEVLHYTNGKLIENLQIVESNRRDGTNKNDQIIVDFLNEIDKSIWEKQSEKNKKKTKYDMYWDCNGLWCDRYKRPITGILVDHHLNGAISNERSLKDGKLEGLSRYYNKDGSLQSERIIDGEKELLRFYENNGNLETEEIKNGPKELSRRYDEFGRLMYEIYEDPTLKIKRDYDQKGNLISEFKDSEDGSTHRSYYENGDLKSESQSKDENRVVKSYYENGKLENVEFYKNNERNGTWKFYSKEGNIVEEHIYVNGVHTITRRYDTNGNLWEEYSFVKPFFSKTYNNGKLVTDCISDDYSNNICKHYDENGIFLKETVTEPHV